MHRLALSRLCLAAIIAALPGPLAWAGVALVGNEASGTVSLIDTVKDEVVGEIKTGGKPRGIAVQRERGRAFVFD